MNIPLNLILELVGKIGDEPGDDVPREKFRRFLTENVKELGQIRDYIGECIRNPKEQYNRALQDLVNYLGQFLEFEVTFGRYHGVSGQIGFDGLWKSPTGFYIVVEAKTSEVYAIKTATLVGYVDELISERKIPSWEHALGLYVIGRPDPQIHQLENAIIAERRTQQLRIISVESLLSLVEIFHEYDVNHEDILSVIKPARPAIDPIVDMMTRLIAQPVPVDEGPSKKVPLAKEELKEIEYWVTPVRGDEEKTPEEVIKILIGEEKIYAFGERTPGRRHLKSGDMICFYAVGKGVVAHAEVLSQPEKGSHPSIQQPERYPWLFRLKNENLYLDNPIVIDALLRAQLDAFRERDANKSWAWFVQATRKISENDFNVLTKQEIKE